MGELPDLEHAMFGMPIVVGIDESATAQYALSTAMQLAQSLGSSLVVVSAYRRVRDSRLRVSQLDAPTDLTWRLQGDSDVQALLDDARERADRMGVAIECVAREGTPATVIVDVASERRAGLVVVGNRGMRGHGRIMGSVPNDVSHNAPCSVLIVDTAAALAPA